MEILRKRSLLGALAFCVFLAAGAGPASGQTPTQELRALLMVVDGNQPVPRSLRHYENGVVTNTTWTDASTLHHFAFERNTSFASLLAEMSFGQLSVTGDTILMALPYDASAYTWRQWTAFADAEAQSRGFNLSDYDRFLYILPFRPSDLSGSGLAVGTAGLCTHLGYVELSCLFHEFGHTIGLRHAAQLRPDGTSDVRGDKSDGLMGSGFNAHANVVNKHLAGWLTGSRLQTFDATGSASFALASQSTAADAPQAVKIVNRGAHPDLGVVDTFVSYRDTNGFDGQLLESAPDGNGDEVANSVLVHQWYRSGSGDTIYRRALEAGETYDEYGVTVTVDGISAEGAAVTVTRAPYDPAPPEMAITPQNSNAHPRDLRTYTVSVTNTNDPAEVPFESYYNMSFTPIGAGWLMGWGSLIGSVAPGETRDFQFLVAAPSNAALGTYDFTLTATDSDDDAGTLSVQASASYTVVAPGVETDPPTAPTGLTGTTANVSVSLTWGPATDAGSGVAGYEVLRDDGTPAGSFAPIATTTRTRYTDTAVTAGVTYRYTVRALDVAGNVGPDSNVFAITAAFPVCSDGLDNDGDLLTDFPEDPGCPFAEGTKEDPECDDGLDNDGDGTVDFDDPDCSAFWSFREGPAACGLGFELALLLPALMGLYALRRQRSVGR